jgi:Tfp pilus assembly protein PilN
MTARINLAPEVYQHAQQNKSHKRLATSLAVLISAVAIGLVVALLVLIGVQKVYLTSVRSTIASDESKLQTFPDLQEAVTVQQDLTSLSSLEGQRVYLTKFLNVLQQTDPQGVTLSSLSLDSSNDLQVSASATNFNLATKLAKALEASNVQIGQNASASNSPYFSNVTLSEVDNSGQGGVSFSITAQVASGVTSGQ